MSHTSRKQSFHIRLIKKENYPFSLHKFHTQNILRKGGMLMMVEGRHFYEIEVLYL